MGINELIAVGGGYRPPAFDYMENKSNTLVQQGQGLRNQLMQQQVQAQPYQRELDEQSLKLRELAMDIRAKAFEAMQAGKPGKISLDYPNFTLEGPADAMAEAASMVAQYPDQANDPNFMPWLAQLGISAKAREPKGETDTYGSPQKGLDEQGNPVMFQADKKGNVRILSGVKPTPEKGMKIYDRDGNLLVDMSGGAGPEMTTKTKGDIEEKLMAGREALARIQAIKADYKPEYQEIGARWSATWTGIKAKMGKDVPKEDAQQLTKWKKFQRKSIENINLYIKEITGAQMSEKEANRLRLAQPDPGENWWQGDDPITFKAKLDDIEKATRAAIARYDYYKKKGLSDEEVKGLINSDKAITLETLMKNMGD